MSSTKFGRVSSGLEAQLFVLQNNNGMQVHITNYGGAITQIWVPDADGRFSNVVLGFDNLRQYQEHSQSFGALIGRDANRIANASFTLDGITYQPDNNDGQHCLRGGSNGFDKQIWTVRASSDLSLVLQLDSAHMDGGFPGNLNVTVGYHLNDRNELGIIYNAQSDRRTPCNLTNQTFFNLAGAGNGSVHHHRLKLHCSEHVALDDQMNPTYSAAVLDTPMDYRQSHSIRSIIGQVPHAFDHTWLRDPGYGVVAELRDYASARKVTMYSTEPAVHCRTANNLGGFIHGNGGTYREHAGICFAAQRYPNAPNMRTFPSTILSPGELYTQTTVYQFSIQD